jgi:hypothetical protein
MERTTMEFPLTRVRLDGGSFSISTESGDHMLSLIASALVSRLIAIWAVRGAGRVEEGEHVGGAVLQRAAEPPDLDRRSRDSACDGVDDRASSSSLLSCRAPGRPR